MEVESLSNSNLLEPCVCTKRTQSDHNFFIEVDEDEDRMIDEDINDRAHPVGQLAKVHGAPGPRGQVDSYTGGPGRLPGQNQEDEHVDDEDGDGR